MQLNVIKIGGNVIDDPVALESFLKDFTKIEGPKILVHGGGKEATRLSSRLGIETRMIEGRRVTDRPTLEIVTMVYAGLVNKRIVSHLQALGCDAIGLCGADGNVIKATMRPKTPRDYGFVGDINPDEINAGFIRMLTDKGLTPVFCAINHDGRGELLNCNADSVASAVAIACSKFYEVTLTYCFEKAGVLTDVDNPDSLIPEIDSKSYEILKSSGAVSGGMIPKIDNAFAAISKGVTFVTIKSAGNIAGPTGTLIRH